MLQDEESIASYRKWIEEDGGFGKKIKPSESLLELMPPKATKHPVSSAHSGLWCLVHVLR